MSSHPQAQLEGSLAHLPPSDVVEYKKGRIIYCYGQPAVYIHLVIEGKVKVERLIDNRDRNMVVDIYQADDMFGLSELLNFPQISEQAMALENTKLMRWLPSEINQFITQRPRLGLALLQRVLQRNDDLFRRIESHGQGNVAQRLARALIRFIDRMGTKQDNDSFYMMPITHQDLSDYIGTSREIVTFHMNQFRRQGFIRYSRKRIIIYREALSGWLGNQTGRVGSGRAK